MSLITDLLSKIKQQEPVRDVPPLLKHAVQQAHGGRQGRGPFTILLAVVLAVAAAGVAALFVMDYSDRSPKALRTTQAAAPGPVQRHDPAPTLPEPPAIEKGPLPAVVKKDPEKDQGGTPARKKAPTQKLARKGPPAPIEDLRPEGKGKAPGVEREAQGEKNSRESKQDRDVYLYAARSYESQKDYHKALSSYRKVLTVDPGNYAVMNNMAGSLIQLGSYEEAIGYAEQALQIRKDYLYSLVNLGIAYSHLGKFAEAETHLQRALSLEQSNRKVLLNLGLLYERRMAYDKAGVMFTGLSDLGDVQGLLGLARIAEKQGKTQAAVDFYRAVLSREKRDSQAWSFASDRIWQLTR